MVARAKARPKLRVATNPQDVDDQIAMMIGDTDLTRGIRYTLSTGISVLDWAMGGGIPSGHAVEWHGEESSGKTTTAFSAGSMMQDSGGKVYYVDAEWGAMDDWAGLNGIDFDPSIWRKYRPACIEDSIRCVQMIVKARAEVEQPTLIVWDTVAGGGAHCNNLDERDIGKNPKIGVRASLMTRFFESGVMHAMLNRPIFLILINQVREDIGSLIPGRLRTPGGRCMKHWPVLRVLFEVKETIPGRAAGDPPLGKVIKAKVVKSKLSREGRSVLFPLYSESGPDDEQSLLMYAQKAGVDIIRDSGSWVHYNDKAYTVNTLRDLMREDRAVFDLIRAACKERFNR